MYTLGCHTDTHTHTHLPSDHLTIRALLSRVSFPSSSLLARHRIVFSTCDKEQPALECTDKQNPHFIFKRELKDTHLQLQPGSSFFIQHFFILKFILIVLRIKGSKKEDSKKIYRNITLNCPELAVEQLYVVDHIVSLACNGLLQSWCSTYCFEYHILYMWFYFILLKVI